MKFNLTIVYILEKHLQLDMAERVCSSSTWEVEAGGSNQAILDYTSEFEASLAYTRSSQKQKKNKS